MVVILSTKTLSVVQKNWQTQVLTSSVQVYLVVKKALEGPSIMPGGQKEAYELVADVLEEISAKAPEDGAPCVTYIGPDGAGHYVKWYTTVSSMVTCN